MEWVALALLAAAVVAGTVLVATGRVEPALLSEPTSTQPPLGLPDEPGSEDVDRLRLGTAVYGYSADDVDTALEARRTRLAEQERELAEREGELAEQEREPADDESESESADEGSERTDEGRVGAEGDGHVHPDA